MSYDNYDAYIKSYYNIHQRSIDDDNFIKLTKRYNFNDYFFDIDNFFIINIDYLNFLTGYHLNPGFHHYVNVRRKHDEFKFYEHYSDEFIDSYNTTLCYEHNDDRRTNYIDLYWDEHDPYYATRIIDFYGPR